MSAETGGAIDDVHAGPRFESIENGAKKHGYMTNIVRVVAWDSRWDDSACKKSFVGSALADALSGTAAIAKRVNRVS